MRPLWGGDACVAAGSCRPNGWEMGPFGRRDAAATKARRPQGCGRYGVGVAFVAAGSCRPNGRETGPSAARIRPLRSGGASVAADSRRPNGRETDPSAARMRPLRSGGRLCSGRLLSAERVENGANRPQGCGRYESALAAGMRPLRSGGCLCSGRLPSAERVGNGTIRPQGCGRYGAGGACVAADSRRPNGREAGPSAARMRPLRKRVGRKDAAATEWGAPV